MGHATAWRGGFPWFWTWACLAQWNSHLVQAVILGPTNPWAELAELWAALLLLVVLSTGGPSPQILTMEPVSGKSSGSSAGSVSSLPRLACRQGLCQQVPEQLIREEVWGAA